MKLSKRSSLPNPSFCLMRYLEDPKVGDVYGVKQENGSYTLYLLSEVKGDSLGFRINNFEVNRSSQLSVIRNRHAEDYGTEIWYYAKGELRELMENSIVVNIRRD